jgi:hypothetical protein
MANVFRPAGVSRSSRNLNRLTIAALNFALPAPQKPLAGIFNAFLQSFDLSNDSSVHSGIAEAKAKARRSAQNGTALSVQR